MSSTVTPSSKAPLSRSALRNLSNSNTSAIKSNIASRLSPSGKSEHQVARRLSFGVSTSMAKHGEILGETSCVPLTFSIYEDCNENELQASIDSKKQLKIRSKHESRDLDALATVTEERHGCPDTTGSNSRTNKHDSMIDTATQTKMGEDEVKELLFTDEPSTEYYKQLAEARRVALKEALNENEKLHQEITSLRSENAKLRELAEQAEYFATIARALLNEADADAGIDGEQTDMAVSSETRRMNSTRNDIDSESALFDSALSSGASCSVLSSDNACERVPEDPEAK